MEILVSKRTRHWFAELVIFTFLSVRSATAHPCEPKMLQSRTRCAPPRPWSMRQTWCMSYSMCSSGSPSSYTRTFSISARSRTVTQRLQKWAQTRESLQLHLALLLQANCTRSGKKCPSRFNRLVPTVQSSGNPAAAKVSIFLKNAGRISFPKYLIWAYALAFGVPWSTVIPLPWDEARVALSWWRPISLLSFPFKSRASFPSSPQFKRVVPLPSVVPLWRVCRRM